MLFLKTSAAKSDPEVTSLLINSTKVGLFFYVVFVGFSDFQPLKFSEAFCSCMGIYLASTWLAQANRLILR